MKLQTFLGDYNMNILKIALLGTAAVAAVSVSARADNLSDLKAQIEMLNARVATLEVAPAVPAGYSMVAFTNGAAPVVPGLETRRGASPTAHYITIMPTADAPAAASTVVTWSGNVKAAVIYDSAPPTSVDIVAKFGLHVNGKTDTAVGEVGVDVGLQGAAAGLAASNRFNNPFVLADGFWGYWKLTPELTLGGGSAGSLSGIGYGYDGACTCVFTDFADAGYSTGDAAQMRLSYASGPMSAAIAIEDGGNAAGASGFGFAGELKYAGDMVSGELSAGYVAKTGIWVNDRWVVGAGLGFNLGDMAKLSMAGGVFNTGAVGGDGWKASVLARLNVSDVAHAEVAFNHADYSLAANDQNSVLAGLYYDPVKQLTIGIEGEWAANPNVANSDHTRADLVTVFRF
jgi:hypothetical protein